MHAPRRHEGSCQRLDILLLLSNRLINTYFSYVLFSGCLSFPHSHYAYAYLKSTIAHLRLSHDRSPLDRPALLLLLDSSPVFATATLRVPYTVTYITPSCRISRWRRETLLSFCSVLPSLTHSRTHSLVLFRPVVFARPFHAPPSLLRSFYVYLLHSTTNQQQLMHTEHSTRPSP